MELQYNQDFYRPQIANIPILHQGELLYSWIGRVHQLNATSSVRWTSQTLYGHPSAALAHDFPSHLSFLKEHFGNLIPNIASLSRHHSLFEFFLPWLTAPRIHLVRDYVKLGHHAGIKHQLGLPASRLGASHPLKACAMCVSEDIDNYGYAYWLARHQYPTCWVCDQHNVILLRYNAQRPLRHYRHFVAPHTVQSEEWISPDIPVDSIATLLNLQVLAENAAALAPAHLNARSLSRSYRLALSRQGLLSTGGSIRIRRLIELVRDTYTSLRPVPGFHIVDDLSDDWAGFVGNVSRPMATVAHPMKHLMLINVLFSDWRDFVHSYDSPNESEVPAAPLVEPDSRILRFIALVSEEGHSVTAAGQKVGITTTTAVRWAKLNGLSFTSRSKYISHEMWESCRTLLRKGVSKQLVAKEVNISMTTVTRLLSSEPELRSEWRGAILRRKRAQYREDFKLLCYGNPGTPLKLIRRLPNNRYAWLYRYDRTWLINTLNAVSLAKVRRPSGQRQPKRADKRTPQETVQRGNGNRSEKVSGTRNN